METRKSSKFSVLTYVVFWAALLVVMVPVMLGLMTDSVWFAIASILWGAMWWAIFTHTKRGKRAFLKGYRIAAAIMGNY